MLGELLFSDFVHYLLCAFYAGGSAVCLVAVYRGLSGLISGKYDDEED